MRFLAYVATSMAALLPCSALAATDASFQVESSIELPGVGGRIDHLAYDASSKRLFVAELGNDSVDVVDVGSRTVTRHIVGLHEPQGIAWSSRLGRLYVACADGTVKAFSGRDYSPVASTRLG